jgi:CRP/FNR family transcriptional regulator, anaerobic regulatory protein
MIVGQARANGHYTPCAQCPLRHCKALRPFNAEELAFVDRFKIDELHVGAGAGVLRQGASSEHLYTVLRGWAFRYKMLPDGRRQILNYALPADLIGLQGSLMGEMEHSVDALTEVTLCVFPRAKLWDLYSRFPSLAFDLTWLAAREEQLGDESLVSLGRRTALERTAYMLLHLFVRAEEAGMTRDGSIQFPFTQQHMADTLGMSLVHTNKTLKRLAATQAIRWKDRVFAMLDRGKLASLAGGDVPAHRPRPFI